MNLKQSLFLTAGLSAMFAASSQAVLVVDDNFAVDGTASTDASYFTSSNVNALETNANSLGLVSGPSGRSIHALFNGVTLANDGDFVSLSFNFTTPATVNGASQNNETFRFGLFSSEGKTSASELAQNLSFTSSSPQPLFNGLDGYLAELDVRSGDPTSDITFRKSNPSTSGQFLASTSGFTIIGSGPDAGYDISANTDYTATLSFVRNAASELVLTSTLFDGTTTFSNTATDVAPLGFDFDLFTFAASSDAFGSSSTALAPDNGIDFTNITIESNVPEPGTLALGLLGGLTLLGRRR